MIRQATIIHTGGIGDFLQTWPVLEELRRRESQRRIVILGRPERAALAVAGGLADEAADFETSGCHRLFAAEADLESMPATLRDAELVINFLPHPVFNANLARLARGQVVGATSFPAAGETDLPAARFVYEQVAAKLGWVADSTGSPQAGGKIIPRLRLKADAEATARLAARFPRLAETVAIHPGSGSPKKNWRREGFEDLAARLVDAGVPVIWILGPAEQASPEPQKPIKLLRNEPLVEVARVLCGVRGYVGNDSGITHLAAAVGTATVALWGPTDRRVWEPRGPRVAVLPGEASAGEVLETLYGTM